MLKSVSKAYALALAGLLLMPGCGKQSPGGDEVKTVTLENLPLPELDRGQGIHPSKAVLDDSHNPFHSAVASEDLQWGLNTWGLDGEGKPIPSKNVARFYMWSTKLASSPNGTAQMYVGDVLTSIASTEGLTPEQQAAFKQAAIQAYQSVLDNFPESITYYSATGFYRNVNVAFNKIGQLGGTPKGNWIVLPGFDGVSVVPGK